MPPSVPPLSFLTLSSSTPKATLKSLSAKTFYHNPAGDFFPQRVGGEAVGDITVQDVVSAQIGDFCGFARKSVHNDVIQLVQRALEYFPDLERTEGVRQFHGSYSSPELFPILSGKRAIHALEVAGVVHAMTTNLGLSPGLDLETCVLAGLCHDIATTPFSHAGETGLNAALRKRGIALDPTLSIGFDHDQYRHVLIRDTLQEHGEPLCTLYKDIYSRQIQSLSKARGPENNEVSRLRFVLQKLQKDTGPDVLSRYLASSICAKLANSPLKDLIEIADTATYTAYDLGMLSGAGFAHLSRTLAALQSTARLAEAGVAVFAKLNGVDWEPRFAFAPQDLECLISVFQNRALIYKSPTTDYAYGSLVAALVDRAIDRYLDPYSERGDEVLIEAAKKFIHSTDDQAINSLFDQGFQSVFKEGVQTHFEQLPGCVWHQSALRGNATCGNFVETQRTELDRHLKNQGFGDLDYLVSATPITQKIMQIPVYFQGSPRAAGMRAKEVLKQNNVDGDFVLVPATVTQQNNLPSWAKGERPTSECQTTGQLLLLPVLAGSNDERRFIGVFANRQLGEERRQQLRKVTLDFMKARLQTGSNPIPLELVNKHFTEW